MKIKNGTPTDAIWFYSWCCMLSFHKSALMAITYNKGEYVILLCISEDTVLPGNCGFAAVLHSHLFYHLFSLLHRIVAGEQQAAVKLAVGCLGVCGLSHMGGWGGAASLVAQQPPSARPDLFA